MFVGYAKSKCNITLIFIAFSVCCIYMFVCKRYACMRKKTYLKILSSMVAYLSHNEVIY